jgi:hypothetical protein
MGPLEDGSCPNREIFLTVVAAVKAIFTGSDVGNGPADGTGNAIFPAATFEILPGGFLVREHFEKLESADG